MKMDTTIMGATYHILEDIATMIDYIKKVDLTLKLDI
jgi:hypothetical protein